MFEIRFVNKDGEQYSAYITAPSKEEAVKIFHKEISDSSPTYVSHDLGRVVVRPRRR